MSRPGLRRDIQGLRAVAVIVVVLNHLLDWPSGGFVGVDIFFVISGYLITDLMLREQDRTGRVLWVGFYRRRIRRIIPVAVVVLAVTVVVSRTLYPAIRAGLIRADAGWAAIFLSNWHFAKVKTDYFDNEALVSPLQHFWSLAVEEQFYVVWPVVVIAVCALANRRLPYRQALAAVISAAVLASFLYSLNDSQRHAASAYFSTPARVWELGIGALIAVIAPQLTSLPTWSRQLLAWSGFAGIVASMFLISGSSTFPAPWALLPVASTGAVIASGVGVNVHGLLVLTNPVAQYIGNVSYSLYLWHFPIIVMLRDFSPEGGAWRTVLIIAAMASVTVFSFHLIEDPIRRSSWLDPRAGARKIRYTDAVDPGFPRRAGFILLAMAVVCSSAFAGHLATRVTPAGAGPVAVNTAAARGATGFTAGLASQIDAALNATQFPALSPTIDQLDANKAPQWKDCGTTGPWNAAKCTYSTVVGSRKVAVIGDSIALSWLPGLIKAFNGKGYNVHSFVAGHCPAARVGVGDGSDAASCDEHRTWAIDAIRTLKPDIIVMSDANFLIPTLHDHATGGAATAEWEKGAVATLKKLTPIARTVVLSSPPGSKNLINCKTILATPTACNGSSNDPATLQLRSAEREAATQTHATYIDASPLFCGVNGSCPSFVGTTPVYVDGDHLTRQYCELIAPGLVQLFGLKRTT